jgi:hypothetical protein
VRLDIFARRMVSPQTDRRDRERPARTCRPDA